MKPSNLHSIEWMKLATVAAMLCALPVPLRGETPDAGHTITMHGERANTIETLHTTPNHRFWVTNRTGSDGIQGVWLSADQLKSGDRFLLANGQEAVLKESTLKTPATKTASSLSPRVRGSYRTHNFEVADNHTYFAGKSGVWVHNMARIPCTDHYDLDNPNAVIALGGKKTVSYEHSYIPDEMFHEFISRIKDTARNDDIILAVNLDEQPTWAALATYLKVRADDGFVFPNPREYSPFYILDANRPWILDVNKVDPGDWLHPTVNLSESIKMKPMPRIAHYVFEFGEDQSFIFTKGHPGFKSKYFNLVDPEFGNVGEIIEALRRNNAVLATNNVLFNQVRRVYTKRLLTNGVIQHGVWDRVNGYVSDPPY